MSKSRNALASEIVEIRRGLHIYKVNASPFWRVRMRDIETGRYRVRSTKETTKLEARKVAEEMANLLPSKVQAAPVQKEFSFEHFAEQVIADARHQVSLGNRPARYVEFTKFPFFHSQWGLMDAFGRRDIREITTRDYVAHLRKIRDINPTLSNKTYTNIRSAFRKVLHQAIMNDVLDKLPELPSIATESKKSPRTFFRFFPAFPKERDEYKTLLRCAKSFETSSTQSRASADEFYDILLFAVHGFVRPTYSELYALKHEDVSFRSDPTRKGEWLVLQIRKGKTGRRMTDTMPAAATVYKRIQKRYPNAKPDDYIFLPETKNRPYAARLFREWFNELLKYAQLETDETGRKHQVYDLRHTGLAMRVYQSRNQTADLFVLAKNAGTSMKMLEQFYLANVPLSEAMVANLQSFGNTPNTKA